MSSDHPHRCAGTEVPTKHQWSPSRGLWGNAPFMKFWLGETV